MNPPVFAQASPISRCNFFLAESFAVMSLDGEYIAGSKMLNDILLSLGTGARMSNSVNGSDVGAIIFLNFCSFLAKQLAES